MKRFFYFFVIMITLCLAACNHTSGTSQIVTTTMPIYTFTNAICDGTDLSVCQLIHDNVSCLHDYTLQVSQMQMIERADVVIINGAGLESFLADAMESTQNIIDCSQEVEIKCNAHSHHHTDTHDHNHNSDAHIWLSPANAKTMAETICSELSLLYPEHKDRFIYNLASLFQRIDSLQAYGNEELSVLKTKSLITFHNGFSYFADSFHLNLLYSIEEEAGSETSAAKLITIINMVNDHDIPAIFTERNGSTASARIVSTETNANIHTLDMGITKGDYFEVMYHNIDTIKEALG